MKKLREAIRGSKNKWDKPRFFKRMEQIKEWWEDDGCASCSMCDHFRGLTADCKNCPLDDTVQNNKSNCCCIEWDTINEKLEDDTITPKKFRKLAQSLYDRLDKLEKELP